MKRVLILYTIYTWFVVCLMFLTHFITVSLLWPFFKGKQDVMYWWASYLLKVGTILSRVKINVHGSENLPKEEGFLVAANHQSLLDIPVLMVGSPVIVLFFAKKELMKVPVLGWDIKNMGHYIVDRQSPKIALKQMSVVRDGLKAGKNLLVFPEGTRTVNGKVQDFKRGAFVVASETMSEVVPCYIRNTGNLLHKKSFVMRPGTVDIYFGKPIKPDPALQDKVRASSQQLKEKVFSAVLDLEKAHLND